MEEPTILPFEAVHLIAVLDFPRIAVLILATRNCISAVENTGLRRVRQGFLRIGRNRRMVVIATIVVLLNFGQLETGRVNFLSASLAQVNLLVDLVAPFLEP